MIWIAYLSISWCAKPIFLLQKAKKKLIESAKKELPYTFEGIYSYHFDRELGPVVQSVVSLTSLLRVILLTVLVDSIYNILIFFAEKMWVAFALQKLLTFFQQKISAYLRITQWKF